MARPFSLGYFAPLPPARSGVADYAAAMLDGLRALGTVHVEAAGSTNLYHLGNNRLHADAYQRALREPGLVLLHDAMLHHFLLGQLDEAAYRAEFVYNYGEWHAGLAADLWRRRGCAMTDPLYFRYPLLRRTVEAARVVLVHGEAGRRAVLAQCPEARVAVIPHLRLGDFAESHWTCALRAADRARFRREGLGLRSGELVVGVYGYLRESKRLASVLEAVTALRAEGLPLRLLVVGDFASEDYRHRWEARLQQDPAVIAYRGVREAHFQQLLEAADVCVNLKYPQAGESSGIAARALALGTPLVLSSNADADAGELPRGTFAPVATGPAEGSSLRTVLGWLLGDRDARQALALEGRRWCQNAMDPALICRKVWRLAQSAVDRDG
ncbi:MAG: hypothetical protein MUF01_06195 [Bryobacterales bacterium]|jgi:glycosyltransferase involved in cell wall biosynthesis|nr:hypothetical protein [Bryobacterales bacterium]